MPYSAEHASDTTITGEALIGATASRGSGPEFTAIDPRSGEALPTVFADSSTDDVRRACQLAADAFDIFRETSNERRAHFLELIAAQMIELGDALIDRACAETGLPRGRIEGERGRTVGQLRLFAALVREGSYIEPRIDLAQPERKPLPRSDIRQRHIAIGPVAVFGASNFPLAFSVAGGDTASAFAAGCPVVVKAHPAHPGTSELVGRAIQRAVGQAHLPEGVFSMLAGQGHEVGSALVLDPAIKAVGFTGSRQGGLALSRLAFHRPEPIPVFAEMSSVNPVFLLPGALAARADSIGRGFAASLTLGAGQFCTNPGLVIAIKGPYLDSFIASAAQAIRESPATVMLTPGIHSAFTVSARCLAEHRAVEQVAIGQPPQGGFEGQAMLAATGASEFLAHPSLQQEIFGAASLVVRCADEGSMLQVAEALEGQLTATLQMEPEDTETARHLLPILERKAGRILVNGFPTGVEVGHAMVHGGPYPATSASGTTSVGTLAVRRFLRPVCYQDMPASLLPQSLCDANPDHLWRQRDGVLGKL